MRTRRKALPLDAVHLHVDPHDGATHKSYGDSLATCDGCGFLANGQFIANLLHIQSFHCIEGIKGDRESEDER